MSATRKIAYLVSHYPAANHTYILREVRMLKRSGWDIRVASIRPDTRPLDTLTSEDREERAACWCVTAQGAGAALQAHLRTLVTNPCGYFRGLGSAFSLARMDVLAAGRNLLYFTEALLAGQWMRHEGLCHFHTHFATTVGLLLRRVFPVSMSITIHGPSEFDAPSTYYLRQKIEASLFVCAISYYGRSQLMRASEYDQWSKFEVTSLGVDGIVFTPPAERPVRTRFEILTVATLSPAKGLHVLVDALARLVHDGRAVLLRIVGDGPDRPSLERHIRASALTDHVRLEGILNQDQVLERYNHSDLFALASFAEGVPIVLMEAMAMELACVATRITGVPELIRDGVDGLLVPASDAGQFADAVAHLMDDSRLRMRLAKSGRQRVLECYDLERNTARFAGIIERHLGAAERKAGPGA